MFKKIQQAAIEAAKEGMPYFTVPATYKTLPCSGDALITTGNGITHIVYTLLSVKKGKAKYEIDVKYYRESLNNKLGMN